MHRSHADRMAIGIGFMLGRLQWLRSSARARSRRAIHAIAGPGPGRDAMARAHLANTVARDRLIRRPWMVQGIPADGAEHLRTAFSAGRGVLVSYCHFGPFPALGVTVVEHVSNVHQVAGAWLAAPRPEFSTERVRRWRSMFESAGVPLVTAEGGFPHIVDLLRRGAAVVMAFDWPGSAETTFLGRPVRLASGTAKLAETTGAMVVPVMRHFQQLRARTVFGSPLDPREHTGWRGLHDALAARHERWILERPAALEDPCRDGAWGESATAERWGSPGGE